MSPDRDARIKAAVQEGLARAAIDVARNAGDVDGPVSAYFEERAEVHILAQLRKISVVPNYEKVEGVDYSYDGIMDIRSELTRARDAALQQNAFEWVLVFTHSIALLHLLAEVIKETS